MYPNPLVLTVNAANHSYDYRGPTPDGGSKYVALEGTLELPQTLTVKHTITKKGSINQTRRSVVKLDLGVKDANGNADVASCYLVTVVPEKIATEAQVQNLLQQMMFFLEMNDSDNIQRIINAEI